jgi:hypothetical protein
MTEAGWRLPYLDNLEILLVIGVIAVHKSEERGRPHRVGAPS